MNSFSDELAEWYQNLLMAAFLFLVMIATKYISLHNVENWYLRIPSKRVSRCSQ
jgi:hypothetical protein